MTSVSSPPLDMEVSIDVTFDFRTDTPPGRDPDTFSPTLRNYHRLLWSKPLPNGRIFVLDAGRAPYYFHHVSDLGEFWLSSDTVVPTFRRARELAGVLAEIPSVAMDEFYRLGYTIGGMMLFPANRVGGKMTINGARGCNARIRDRFDLTVECIRRHYAGDASPLGEALGRYANFFGLFGDFTGYVDFFLLQDLVDQETGAVRFFAPFESFAASPLPRPLDVYIAYRRRATEFIQARNQRIAAWVNRLGDKRPATPG